MERQKICNSTVGKDKERKERKNRNLARAHFLFKFFQTSFLAFLRVNSLPLKTQDLETEIIVGILWTALLGLGV